jgi:uncharacterized coiled-coil protein SlyX
MGERTTFNFRVDKDFKNKFCEMAKANGTTATDLITQWMQDYMEGQPCTDNANTANTEREDDSKKQDDQKRLNRVIVALEHRVRDLESKSAGKDDSQIQQLQSELQRQEQEIQDLKHSLEGLSCDITFPSTMGTKPRDAECRDYERRRIDTNLPQTGTTNTNTEVSKQGDTVCNSYASYSASQVASEIGKSSRTVRDHLSKLSIGEVYQGKWKLVERNPRYKLERIE